MRMALLALFLQATSLAGQTPPDTTQIPDSAAFQDTVFVLEPIAVDVERERAAPPPVIAVTVDAEIVRASQESDPYRILRQVSGVEVHDQGQGPGFASNVIMRGFTSDHSSDVLLVIDGVPVNLPAHGHIEGYADWNVLMTQAVSSMRVIHGGASPLYGDFALGGVVEVFTRADAEGFEGSLGSTTFGDLKADIGGGRRGESGGFYLGSAVERQRGWRDNSDFWITKALARGWETVGDGRLEGGVSLYGTGWDSPGFVSVPRFNDSDVEGAVDLTDGGDSRRIVTHGRYSVPLGEAAYLQASAWGMASDYSIYLNIPDHNHSGSTDFSVQSGEWDQRTGTGGRLEVAMPRSWGDLVLGLSGRSDWVEYRHAATLERDVIDTEIDLDARHTAGALYGRVRRTFGGTLGMDLGARLDVLRHRSRSNLTGGGTWESASNAVFSPKLGLRYVLGPAWSLRGSSARGFRSPAGIIGDPSREPFLSWSHELGVDYTGAWLRGSISLFRVDVTNERIQDPVTLTISSEGSSVRQGVSALGTLALSETVAMDVRLTYNHARLSGAYANAHDDHPHDVFGSEGSPGDPATESGSREVPGVAEFQGFTRMTWQAWDEASLWVSWRGVGSHVPIGEPTVRTQAYSVTDLGATWDVGAGRELDVEMLNLFDARHVELRSSGFVVPGAPRSLRAQIRFTSLPF